MYKLLLLCTVLSVGRMLFAVELPDTWPPAWAGTTHGGAEGVNTDDHNGFDYGVDSWGPWANLEIKDALGGNVVARIEMRYIKKPVAYDMGAPENEQGARVTEKPRVHVPAGDLNGGDPFWISASECTQELWE